MRGCEFEFTKSVVLMKRLVLNFGQHDFKSILAFQSHKTRFK